MDKLRHKLTDGLAALGAVLLALLLLAVLTGVFARQLRIGLPWTEEASRFLLEWLGFASLAAVIAGSGLMVAWRPNSRTLWRVRSLVEVALLAVIVVAAFQHLSTLRGQTSVSMELPLTLVFGIVPVVLTALAVLWLLDEWRGGTHS